MCTETQKSKTTAETFKTMKDLCEFTMPDLDPDSSGKQRSPKKIVHFADSKGLALTSTHVFSKGKCHCENVYKCRQCIPVKHAKPAIDGLCSAEILNFRPPTSEGCIQEALERQNVCLEQLVCFDLGVCGRVRVRNIAFEKIVIVRYSMNSWGSYQEERASYIPGSSNGVTDAFAFQITFSKDDNEENVRKRMEFAICYIVGETAYWDNNYGDNYRLVYV